MMEEMFYQMGVTINGKQPYDIHIRDNRVFTEVFKKQSIGAGEAYMNGWWECDQLDELFYRICTHKIYDKVYSKWKAYFLYLKNALINHQSRWKAEEVANTHYNLGNQLFECMLGNSMAYTCGYWKNAETLDEAEFDKYELICKKMYLQPGEKILEIGCGWGGLAKYMAEKYQCHVVAIDIAREPAKYAKNICRGLPITVYQCDYRDAYVYHRTKNKFDKIVSVGVLEHVGYKNYSTFLKIAHSFLKDDGIFLLHSIGSNKTVNYCEPWINKYIFPNGHLPSLHQLGSAFEKTFIVEDFHNFGAYYDKTLMAWHQNLNLYWDELKTDYNERFHRMMNYYLLSCAGAFRARDMQLWQFVLTPKGMRNGYNSLR